MNPVEIIGEPKKRVHSVAWTGINPVTGTVTVEYDAGPSSISLGSEDDGRAQVLRYLGEEYTQIEIYHGFKCIRWR